MSELPTERPVERQMDARGADAETLIDMGVLEPQPEPAPPEDPSESSPGGEG